MSAFSFYMAKAALTAPTQHWRKRAMITGVTGDLLCLGYFKYANFFVDNANGILTFAGSDGLSVADVLLPIGISFHTFQSISYVIDVYRKDAPPARRLVDFLAFGALFPQLIAGPVLRYKDLANQFVERSHSLELFTKGVYRFFLGLAMKVLIADSVSPLADRIFALPNPTFFESWLGALAYTFQLFFDFAGYSAMAIGLGLMIGFQFIENFNSPYISRSITEFWQRWHISLSTWLRDYLYIPLGGNRRGKKRTYVNLVLTMVLGGFWHGANWTFLIWGIWHGGIMALERAMGGKGKDTVWPKTIALPLTFLLVVLGWVVFRAPDLSSAFAMYGGMIGLNGIAITPNVAWQIQTSELVLMACAGVLCFMPLFTSWHIDRLAPKWKATAYIILTVLAVTRMASQSYSPFLYFQF
ncbi:MBOAT family O-acyltransferase [Pacificibacter maritimus]|nr:MBOAT family protein [Pacificibacter maritimus]